MEWAKKVELMRRATKEHTVFEGSDKASFTTYFSDTLEHTDTFHPFEMDSAMTGMDEELLFEMFSEIGDLVYDFFSNKMNHPPGYKAPQSVSFDADAATDKFLELVDACED